MSEVNLREKRITIMEAQKTRVGRVAYVSEDAYKALTVWLNQRDPAKERLFYGRGSQRLGYTIARVMFGKYLEKAGMVHKGYSLHCLRHTCATKLLNAGMRLECLQQFLGHSSIEMARRYARLTDDLPPLIITNLKLELGPMKMACGWMAGRQIIWRHEGQTSDVRLPAIYDFYDRLLICAGD
jgi:integrase